MDTPAREVDRCDVCIVGAGISGLTAAFKLQQAGVDVVLLEKRRQPGGVMRTEVFDGLQNGAGSFVFDMGPNSLLTKSPHLLALIDELGIAQIVCYADERTKKRWILRDGALQRLPRNPATFLKSDLLSWRGKLRLLAEPFIRSKRERGPETIADFTRRRLGQEALDYLVNPVIAGIYAGDPEQIYLPSALPRLAALENEHGSLIRGAIAKMREARKKKISSGPKGRMLSFDTGMAKLVDSIAGIPGVGLRTGAEVVSIHRASESTDIVYREAQGRNVRLRAGRLILAAPSYVAAELLEPLHPETAAALAQIRYAPVAVAYHGYPKAAIGNALDGSGFLVPEKEGRRILGTIWSSTFFPKRAPEGYAALTTFAGGTRQPELMDMTERELLGVVENELQELLNIDRNVAPTVRSIKIWKNAIPQYGRSHARILAQIEALERQHPWMQITGSFRKGVGVADCIAQATEIAQNIIRQIHDGPKPGNTTLLGSETRNAVAPTAPD